MMVFEVNGSMVLDASLRRIAALCVLAGSVGTLTLSAFADRASNDLHETLATILAIDGDPAFGEYLGGECVTCHRGSTASATIPRINGLDEEHFILALLEYREGIRTNEVMRTTASRLSDEEIAALAAHFAERETR